MYTPAERDEELEKLAYQVINAQEDLIDLRLSEARIAVVRSCKVKRSESRLVFADIAPVNEIHKALIPFDYIITVHKSAYLFDDEQMWALMWHELLHCNVTHCKDGFTFGTKGHDIEDFYAIIEKYGMDWSIKGAEEHAKKTDGTSKFGQPKERASTQHTIRGTQKENTKQGHKGSSRKKNCTKSSKETP